MFSSPIIVRQLSRARHCSGLQVMKAALEMRPPRRVVGWIGRIAKFSALGLFYLALIPSALLGALHLWCVTDRDVAYRNQHPDSPACLDQRRSSDLLAREEYADIAEGQR